MKLLFTNIPEIIAPVMLFKLLVKFEYIEIKNKPLQYLILNNRSNLNIMYRFLGKESLLNKVVLGETSLSHLRYDCQNACPIKLGIYSLLYLSLLRLTERT
jgi:hypothetical protein